MSRLELGPYPGDGRVAQEVRLGGALLGHLHGGSEGATFPCFYPWAGATRRLPEIRGRDWAAVRERIETFIREVRR